MHKIICGPLSYTCTLSTAGPARPEKAVYRLQFIRFTAYSTAAAHCYTHLFAGRHQIAISNPPSDPQEAYSDLVGFPGTVHQAHWVSPCNLQYCSAPGTAEKRHT